VFYFEIVLIGGAAPNIVGPHPLTRHVQQGIPVRQTVDNNIGADTHKLGANDDGAEHRVHFLK
jgi:hypothetical protein